MSSWPPLRGEVWDAEIPEAGEHPAVVLSVNSVNQRLGHLAVVVVTGTNGPPTTHVALSAEAGLTGYPESYANITDLRVVRKEDFLHRRGLCSDEELTRIESLVRVYLGL